MKKKIVIVAGDKSADLYAGLLCKQLKTKYPQTEIFSFAGSSAAQNSRQVIDLLTHSVSGIFEVLLSLRKLLNIFNQTIKKIDKIRPDLIILMDFPDFNLKLAKTLNKKYPLFYYISPQVWAWRKNRVKQIKKYVDKMVVIFKFEEDFYRNQNIEVLYFGHPLLELLKTENIETKKTISFLPGSRKNEIKKHLPIIKEAKKIMEKELENYCFQIIRPPNIEESFYKEFCPQMKVTLHSYKALAESEFIVTSSGTATVEIAVLGVPFLIIYKVNPLTWQLLKRMVKTEFIGMVNILSGEKVIPELLQSQVTPKNIAKETLSCLKNREKYQEIKKNLRKVKETLAPYGATEKFAQFIGGYLHLT